MTNLPKGKEADDASAGTPGATRAAVGRQAQQAAQALARLAETRPELAETMARLVTAIATEAGRTTRFANSLQAALTKSGGTGASGPSTGAKRTGRRTPGVLDPFAVYAETGEAGLRRRLGQLELEQLRDIVAEHGMDHDRLAMKWKDPSRVIDRIVDKVATRATKGSAFRPASD